MYHRILPDVTIYIAQLGDREVVTESHQDFHDRLKEALALDMQAALHSFKPTDDEKIVRAFSWLPGLKGV